MDNKKFYQVNKEDICTCDDNISIDKIINKIKLNSYKINKDDNKLTHYHKYDNIENKCDICSQIYTLVNNIQDDYDDEEEDIGGKKRRGKKKQEYDLESDYELGSGKKRRKSKKKKKDSDIDSDTDSDLYDEFEGGGLKKKKKKYDNILTRPKYFTLENIDHKKIEKMGKRIMFNLIDQNMLISANSLTRDLIDNLIKNEAVNPGERELLVKYIEEHTPYLIKEEILNTHPYFSLTNLNRASLEAQHEMLNEIYKMDIYENYNIKSRFISSQFKDLSSLRDGILGGNICFCEPFIDPVIFCLFANKLTFFDDLITQIDPLSVLNDMIINKKIAEENKFIMFLKASDPSDFITGSNYKTNSEQRLKHELQRLIFHNMIKMQALNIRQGKWYSELSPEIMKMINKIQYRSFKTEEEKIVSAVLNSIPFKPILVSKSSDSILSVPESVCYVEYNIDNFRMDSIKEAFKLDNSIFQNLSYDMTTGRLCVTRRTVGYENKTCLGLNQVNNAGPYIGHDFNFNIFSRSINENIILLANGIIIISIPRIRKTSLSRNYNSGFKNFVIDDPVEFQDVLNVGGETFSFTGAVCCKTYENSGIYDLCLSKEYIGRYSYNKTENGWIKYDPGMFYNRETVERFMQKVVNNPEDGNLNRDQALLKLLNIRDKLYSVNDFIEPDENTVKEDISRYGTLLIYSTENMDNYLCNISC